MDASAKVSFHHKIVAAIRLSRWREHVPFTIPLSLIGSLLAIEAAGADVDWRAFAVIAANIFSMSFAFVINNIADAPDDALNPQKMRRNVISNGVMSPREGWFLATLTAACALLLYALSGVWALAIGGLTLVLCFLYSAHPFRLKARPVTDVLSHALMLSGLLVMTGYFAYDTNPEVAWLVILAAILFSAYGQFYNQIDDYEVDKSAGLQNTVVLLGKPLTRLLSFASLLGALFCMAVSILQGLFPPWLGIFLVIGFLIVLMFPWEFDMRGNLATDGGNMQRPGLIVANLVAMVWLASAMGLLSIG
ncbi:MAG: prenyltransferase [Chloroflexi bacterium]|nr:prenyltransferase [Chloroflexota bacterium]